MKKQSALNRLINIKFLLSLCIAYFLLTCIFVSRVKYVGGSEDGAYSLIGKYLAEGRGFESNVLDFYWRYYPTLVHPVDTFPPLFPLIIAFLLKTIGIHPFLPKIIAIFSGLVLIPLSIFLLGKEMYNEKIGFFAALLTLVSPLNYPTLIKAEAEPLFAALSIFACYFFFKGLKIPRNFVYMGIFLGFAFLTKYTEILVVLSLSSSYTLILFFKKERPNFYFFIGILISLAISSPWLIFNYFHFHDPLYAIGRHVLAYWDFVPVSRLPLDGKTPTLWLGISKFGIDALFNKIVIEFRKVFFSPLLGLYILAFFGIFYSSLKKRLFLICTFLIFLLFHTIYWIYNPTYFIFVTGPLTIASVYFLVTNVPNHLSRFFQKSKIEHLITASLFILAGALFIFSFSKFFFTFGTNSPFLREPIFPFIDAYYTEPILISAEWAKNNIPLNEPIFVLINVWGFSFHSGHPTLGIPAEGTNTMLGLAKHFRVNYTQCNIIAIPLPDERLEVIGKPSLTFCRILWNKINPDVLYKYQKFS